MRTIRTTKYETVAPYSFVGVSVDIKKNANKYVKVSIQKYEYNDSDSSSDDDIPPPIVAILPPFGSVPAAAAPGGALVSGGTVSVPYPTPSASKPPPDPRIYYVQHSTGRITEHISSGRHGSPMTLKLAINEFENYYRKYTGNFWGKPPLAWIKSGKYKLQNIDEPIVIKSPHKTPLDADLTTFIADVYSPDLLNVTLFERKVNREYPLGKINIEQLQIAYIACDEIEPYLDGTIRDNLIKGGIKKTDIDGLITEKLYELTHLVLINIPTIFGTKRDKMSIIDSMELLEWYREKIKTDMASDGTDVDHIVETVNDAAEVYSQFRFRLCVENDKSPMGRVLSDMVAKTMGPTHTEWDLDLLKMYRVTDSRSRDEEGIFSGINDHRLMFHGTTPGNLVNIMETGLHVPSIHQILNGTTLGKGIYFADCITKSFQYCLKTRSLSGHGNSHLPAAKNKHAYILVCEVALGRSKIVCDEDNTEFHLAKHGTRKQLREYEKRPLHEEYQSKTAAGEYQCVYRRLTDGVTKQMIPKETIDLLEIGPDFIDPLDGPGTELPAVRVPTSIGKVSIYSEKPIVSYNDATMNRDGTITIPPPTVQPTTTFHYNEYCIFDENQYRIRYVLMLQYKERPEV